MCVDRSTSLFAFLTNRDQSSATLRCYRVADVAKVAKFAYYAAKLVALLGG